MAKDHFVSQFYLRNFSPDGPEGGDVRSIYLAQRKYISRASIAGQCQRPGFYDGDKSINDWLMNLEGFSATAIRRITDTDLPPEKEDHLILAIFAAIQRSRTRKSETILNSQEERLRGIVYENGQDGASDQVRQALDSDYTMAMQLRVAAHAAMMATDLASHLVINETSEEFICSDHPTIVHNQYCEGTKYTGVTGWNCTGIQLFLPLSPCYLLILYDAKVYSVGKKRDVRRSTITDVRDVRMFNAFQILNANASLYFHSAAMAKGVIVQLDLLAPLRKVNRVMTVQSNPVPNGENTSELLHFFETLTPLKLETSLIRVKRSARRIKMFERAQLRRSGDEPHGEVVREYRARRAFAD